MPLTRISQISLFPIAAIFVLVLVTRTAPDNGDSTTPASRGDWVVYSTGSPGGAALRCANNSRRQWSVSLEGETPRISMLPSLGTIWTDFEGGRLEGLANGEFGGGLWWHNPGRTTRTKISSENIHGIVHTSFGTLVLAGLDHLGMRSGRVLRIIPANPNPPSMTTLADLHEAPRALTLASDGAVVVVTGTKVLRINSPGTVETLVSTNYPTYANSVAISSAGTIYVGMRHFVRRLTPVKQSYEDDWLIPADCTRFAQRGDFDDCNCMDQRR